MRPTPFAPAAALALASLFARPAPAQDDAGLEWARAEVKRSPPPDDVESIYWPARGGPRVLRPCRAACKRSWHLAAAPLGADDLAKRPIYRVTAVPGAAAPPAPAAAPPADERPGAPPAPPAGLDAIVRAYPAAVPATAGGVAQSGGAGAIAEGALQAVGQAVVDRASSAALERVREKIAEGLRCADPPARTSGPFARTCDVVSALRLQDLARHGHVLLDALLRDAMAQALPEVPPAARPALEPLTRVLLPEVSRLLEGRVGRGAEVVAQRLVEAAMADLKRSGVRERLAPGPGGAGRGRAAVALAALGHAQCAVAASAPGAAASLAHCPVDAYVRRAADAAGLDDAAVLTRAHELARLLLDAMTLQSEGAGAWRERASSAASAAFVTACLALDASPELRGCPPAAELGRAPSPLERLALARFLANAAIDGDPNALVVGAVAAAAAAAPAAPEADGRRARRALRLLAALLQSTGASADRKLDGAGGREPRGLLEDLGDEMSDRSERAGDAIWSLGGSLRLAGGARFAVDSGSTAFYGPLSLPFGLGFQTVAEGGFGLHLELSAFDLGQYVSFEEGGRVREPRLADALAPSVTLGAAFGKNVPVVVGPTLGYSPQFAFADGKRGALNFGLALGLYVPLFDLN